jgi:hypothetical protein
LEDVPVFDDLAVAVETENVDSGVVMVVRPGLVAVEHDVVVLGEGRMSRSLLKFGGDPELAQAT